MIYDKIASLCKEKKITIARLEREVGLGNATIAGWRKYTPTALRLKKVADYFGVTVDELLRDNTGD